MNVKSVVLEVEDIIISGQLYLPGDKGPYPAVCICHGIPSGTPDPGDKGYTLLAERICREGFAVLIFNFRGTGDSGGNLDLLGWTRDLEAAIDYLWSSGEVDKPHLSLLGFSGGAAASVYVASQDSRVSCIAACACPAEFTFFTKENEPQPIIDHFRSIGAIRDADFPRSAENWFDGFRLVSPIEYVAGIAPRPLLLVHGSQDETVDISHARRLFDRAGGPKRIVTVDGAGHRLRQDDRAIAVVIAWLKSQCRN
ncbi:alpha/beta hydrolase family protein [Chloroflexota bacterium]